MEIAVGRTISYREQRGDILVFWQRNLEKSSEILNKSHADFTVRRELIVMAFTVRLPEDIAEALQREAERRLSTPAEVLRTAVIHYLGKEQTPEAQHELLYEIAKTRSVLLRFLDTQLGEAVADQLLDVADGDARLYVQQRHPGG